MMFGDFMGDMMCSDGLKARSSPTAIAYFSSPKLPPRSQEKEGEKL